MLLFENRVAKGERIGMYDWTAHPEKGQQRIRGAMDRHG